ncbi:imidazole glycerol phosphate synthase subunit HisH [Enterococcus sp.]|uniref:imidazole glycerol phosphate synthase subunit HisH n=1 Tax=Enterococcus sp. TaxID=35783 RepID=UPI0028AF0AE6|nr:imidazole glycerol phosphate synthase subunit HisH [Enterococcus sp.]
MLAIVDYGVGNVFSIQSSLKHLGIASCISKDAAEIETADQLILPGVGAFGDAKAMLDSSGLIPVIRNQVAQGTPLLGICLGMQLLFEESEEFGSHLGLGLIKGKITSLKSQFQAQNLDLKVPHIGWNTLAQHRSSPITKYISQDSFVYYVHSYYATGCQEALIADSQYGIPIPGIVQQGHVYGTQFHPEKSGDTGLKILKAFAEVNKG